MGILRYWLCLDIGIWICIICFLTVDFTRASYEDIHTQSPAYKRLLDDFWLWRMQTDPEFATTLGIHDFDDRLETFTEQAFYQRKESCSQFVERIDHLDLHMLTSAEMSHVTELRHQLHIVVDGYQWRSYSSYNPINMLEGVHRDTSLWVDAMNFFSLPDWQKYKTRLTALASQINEQISLMQEAVVSGKTYNKVSLTDVPLDLDRLLATPPSHSQLFRPFNESLDMLETSAENRISLRKEASEIIEDQVYPSYRNLKQFLEQEYIPHTRPAVSVKVLAGGTGYYKSRLKWYLADDISPHTLYRAGNDAMLDIMTKIDHIKASVGYTKSINDFLRHVQGANKFFLNTETKLLEEFNKLTQVTIPENTHKILSRKPNIDFVVQRMQFDGPEAIMMPGSEDGEMPAVLFVNVENPFKMPKWKLLSIVLRETIPGKLLQLSYMRNLSLPHFRKYPEHRKLYEVPFHFPSHVAYTEGWSLYAEKLGEDMGLISDPYLQLGQLFSELYRTALLVADSGIHHLGWERQYAVDYLRQVTGLGSLEAEKEVDQIITLPGQACAPIYGYMKIKGLRQLAEERYGSSFNIREFHDIILKLGPVSLTSLNAHVNRWIEENSPVYRAVVSDSGNYGTRNKAITLTIVFLLVISMYTQH